MIPRIRLIIMLLLGCHLFIVPALVTSQLRSASVTEDASPIAATDSTSDPQNQSVTAAQQPAATKPAAATPDDEGMKVVEGVIQKEMQSAAEQHSNPPRPPANVVLSRDDFLIRADEQEKVQDIYKVRGHVEIRFRNNTLHCDEATYDGTTGKIAAFGHGVYDGGTHSEHLAGTHATFDVSRDTGTFYDVTGSTGIQVKNQLMFLRSSTPFFFPGQVVENPGPDLYRVHEGVLTSCQLPKPKWEYHPATATMEAGGHAKMYQ